MFAMIKKIFELLIAMPAFTNLFKKAISTGKIDPMEAVDALSSISSGTRKVSDNALNALDKGGGFSEAVSAVMNTGEVEAFGQKINTKTLIPDLRKAGGICASVANVLDKMQNGNIEDIVDLGNAATDINNWQEFVTK